MIPLQEHALEPIRVPAWAWLLVAFLAVGVYMLAVGMLLGPMVGGNPLLSLAAGVVMAVVTAGGFAVIRRLRARRRKAMPVAALPPAAAPALVAP